MESNESCEYNRLLTNENEYLPESKVVQGTKAKSNDRTWRIFLVSLIVISMLLNVALLYRQNSLQVPISYGCISKYAQLRGGTTKRKIRPHEEYINTDNLTATSLAWDKLSGDPGVVALTKKFTTDMNLPLGLQYPWDASKSVYLLQGYHNLHCLRTIYRSLTEFHLDSPQTNAFEHILHCMDELRQDVICHADDTPRYASVSPSGTGLDQTRTCKDWNALTQWAREHTACFHHENGVPDHMVNRFKNCPDGSQPWLNVSRNK